MLAQYFGQFACVDACDARNLFALQPVAQTFHCIPVRVFFTVIAYDNRFGMDFFALHESRQSVCFEREGRHTIVTYQRVSQCHQLTGIRRVGQAFGVSGHCRVENYFTGYRFLIAERLAMKAAPVVEDQCYISHYLVTNNLYILYFFLFYSRIYEKTPGLAEKQFRVFDKIGNLKYSGNK